MADDLLPALEKLAPEELFAEVAHAEEYLASGPGQHEFGDMFRAKARIDNGERRRHCEERSDEAIQWPDATLDCFASLAMTAVEHAR